jgi:NhaP-type Na+/H+ and K+/H+ antiporter
VAGSGLALALLLMLLIRPTAVWVSTAFNDFTARERLLLGWAGLRGAVPIVLATFVLSSQVGSANTIFNAVFFVVVVSAILQGTTLERVAGKLDLLSPIRPTHEPPIEVGESSPLDLLDFVVAQVRPFARWACREPRSSRWSCAETTRSRRAAARSSSPVTASSSSPRTRCAPPSRTSSSAGGGGCSDRR